MKIRICKNLSAQDRREEALKKFATTLLSFLAIDLLIAFSVPGGWWYAVWLPILGYANFRHVVRPLIFGFFICDRDRRLKHGGHLHPEKVGKLIVCDLCAEECREIIKDLDELQKGVDDLRTALVNDPRLNGRSGTQVYGKERKAFRPMPLAPAIPTIDLGRP